MCASIEEQVAKAVAENDKKWLVTLSDIESKISDIDNKIANVAARNLFLEKNNAILKTNNSDLESRNSELEKGFSELSDDILESLVDTASDLESFVTVLLAYGKELRRCASRICDINTRNEKPCNAWEELRREEAAKAVAAFEKEREKEILNLLDDYAKLKVEILLLEEKNSIVEENISELKAKHSNIETKDTSFNNN